MLNIVFGLITRIFSNSYLNVFQKTLTNRGEYSSVINVYSYLGLTLIGIITCQTPLFSNDIITTICIMGVLGAIGNYFIIKALSCGELSTLAPINSYKPVIALIWGIFILKEIPQTQDILGIGLIILGTFFLGSNKLLYNKATLYRFLALFFSGTEAIFIKKVIILTNIQSAFFYWAFTGLIFATIFAITAKHPIKIKKTNIKYQLALIFLIAIMQYSTNYIFSKINVAYALALFQLSTILNIFLGVNLFKEKDLIKKLIASLIMLFGATILILT